MSDSVDKLEDTGAKRISITGNLDALSNAFSENDKFISDMATNDKTNTITFLYNGKIPALLQILSSLNIKDLTITEPSLEEIFMNYYE